MNLLKKIFTPTLRTSIKLLRRHPGNLRKPHSSKNEQTPKLNSSNVVLFDRDEEKFSRVFSSFVSKHTRLGHEVEWPSLDSWEYPRLIGTANKGPSAKWGLLFPRKNPHVGRESRGRAAEKPAGKSDQEIGKATLEFVAACVCSRI